MPSTLIHPARTEQVLVLWCSLTGTAQETIDGSEREALLHRTEMVALADVPDGVLFDAGTAVRRGRSLPLERWLAAVRVVEPVLAHPASPKVAATRTHGRWARIRRAGR